MPCGLGMYLLCLEAQEIGVIPFERLICLQATLSVQLLLISAWAFDMLATRWLAHVGFFINRASEDKV